MMVCVVVGTTACSPVAMDRVPVTDQRGSSLVASVEPPESAPAGFDTSTWIYHGKSCSEWLAQLSCGSVQERAAASFALSSLFHDLRGWSSLWRSPSRAASLAALDRDQHAGGAIARKIGVLVPPLLQALDDPAPAVREAAVGALLMIGPAAVQGHARLISCLGDASPRVRGWAARALYFVCGDVHLAVDANIRLLEDPDPSIRSMAAYSLELMGEDGWPAYPFLEKRLVDEDPQVRNLIKRAMRTLKSANQRSA